MSISKMNTATWKHLPGKKEQKAIFVLLEQIASQTNLTKEERTRFENV